MGFTFDDNGLPGIQPPWGSITALDLNSGKIILDQTLWKTERVRKRQYL